MTPGGLLPLLHLAEARKAADLGRLDGLMAELRACDAEIAEVAGAAARDLAEGGAPLPPAAQALRLSWADRCIALASARRVALARDIARARVAAVQSLGRHRALETLLGRAERQAATVRESRHEREAPPPEAPPG